VKPNVNDPQILYKGAGILAEQILIIDTEHQTVDTVRYNLERTGYKVMTTPNAETALNMIQRNLPDLILLDPILPGMDGFTFCKHLRQENRTRDVPICVLSEQDDEINRVLAFELGVDDYLKKPFSLRELLLRIRIILKRKQKQHTQPENRLILGALSIDKSAHEAFLDNHPLLLTVIEFQLLTTLMERIGRVQTREDLLNAVWGYEHTGNGRMVDAHIRRMRSKLGKAQSMIRTVRGVGYCFTPENPT
jgi:two-component system, OmpR family, phosphate regulon response regulator PhoB